MGEENEILEFKKTTAETPVALDSIVAMLNKHQKGTLYFGVKNDGTPIGQQMGENTLRDVTSAITNHIEPKIYPIVEKVILNGKECIKVEFKGEDVPYFSYGKAYIRVGDEDKKLSRKEMQKLFIKSSQLDTRWENEITKYSYEDIDEGLLKECILKGNESKRINYKYTNKKDILNRLGLINEDGKLLNAGNALFGKNANIVLKMAIFATNTKVTFLDISRKSGNIMELIDIGETYVKEHIRWTVNFGTGIRRIYQECQKNNVKVEFRQEALGFSVIFYRKDEQELEKDAIKNPKNNIINVPVNVPVNLNKTEKQIISIIINNPNITQKELALELNLTEKTIKRNTNKLKEKGILRRIGADKNGYWEILK